MRTKELSMGLSSKVINERTQELVNKGLVSVVRRSLRDPKRKYVLTRKGEGVVLRDGGKKKEE